MAIAVFILDDRRLIRELVQAQLEREKGMHVVGAAGDREEACRLIDARHPQVLVLGRLPFADGDGPELMRHLRRRHPGVKVVLLSSTNGHTVPRLVSAGADAIVSKSAGVSDLSEAIHQVMNGQRYLTSAAAVDLQRHEAQRTRLEPLSRRERQVLALIAEGRRSRDIAGRLGITPNTAEVHRRNLMRKLRLRSVAELTRFALEAGATTAEPGNDSCSSA